MQDPQLCNQLPRELGKGEGVGTLGLGLWVPQHWLLGLGGCAPTHAHAYICTHVLMHARTHSTKACMHAFI